MSDFKSLSSCNTVAQLHKHYPELAEYLPKTEPATKALTVTCEQVVQVLPKRNKESK